MDPELLKGFGIALGLGLLIGFQRERAKASLAGIRTFTLISLIGACSAHLGSLLAVPWLLPVAFLGLAGLLVSGHVARSRTESPELTTEIAAVLMLLIGALSVAGPRLLAVATGAVIALLLHFKRPLHETVERFADEEVRAVMTFVLIALVVLPLLPDRAFDPLGVLNPHAIWRMVVLIVGISLVAHGAFRVLGQARGAVVAGVIGGLISSTATTVQQARRSAAEASFVSAGVVVTVLASATAFVRILVEVAVVDLSLLRVALAPMGIVLGVLIASALLVVRRARGTPAAPPEPGNPAQLRTALFFGALYAVVILGVAVAERFFGSSGLMIVAVLSGLTDVDAITLSTSQLVSDGRLGADEGWRMILVAALSNLGFKGGLAFALGSRRLAWGVAAAFGAAIAAGLCVVFFWPGAAALP